MAAIGGSLGSMANAGTRQTASAAVVARRRRRVKAMGIDVGAARPGSAGEVDEAAPVPLESVEHTVELLQLLARDHTLC